MTFAKLVNKVLKQNLIRTVIISLLEVKSLCDVRFNYLFLLLFFFGRFVVTLPDTDKKWVLKNCVKVFILPDRDTDTDTDTNAIWLQPHFVGVGIGVSVGQCEHTISGSRAGAEGSETMIIPCCAV